MKKIFSVILSVVLLTVGTLTSSASDDSLHNDVVAEKKALRAMCIENNVRSVIQKMDLQEREEKIQRIYAEFSAGEMEVDDAVAELEKLGVYALQSSIDEYKATKLQQRSSPTVLEYNDVTVFYDSYNDVWQLAAGVWWTDDSWDMDFDYPIFYGVGDNLAVGGLDGVGITLYDISGSFAGCTLEDTWLYVSAGDGELATTSHSPTGNIDSRYGVFHQFQDYVHVENMLGLDIYYGKHMSVFAQYSSEFENFHGRARLQYVHTWENTSISSVGVNFEVGTSSVGAGFEIGLTHDENQFATLSPGETLF